MQTTLYLNLNILCFLNILCTFTCSGPLLISALSAWFYLIYQMPFPTSPTTENPFQPSTTQLRTHFRWKHLPLLPESLPSKNLFTPQLLLIFVIIPSTLFFKKNYDWTSTMPQVFHLKAESAKFFIKGHIVNNRGFVGHISLCHIFKSNPLQM